MWSDVETVHVEEQKEEELFECKRGKTSRWQSKASLRERREKTGSVPVAG